MPAPRYVLLGLASARADWFRRVAQWAQASSMPVEFSKCVSAEELRARVSANRCFSAVLVDANLPSLDRDLIGAARQTGCAVIVVEDRPSRREWTALGADAILAAAFDQARLMDLLHKHARPVSDARSDALEAVIDSNCEPSLRSAMVAAVVGCGGVGASTVAMAVAQGLGRPPGPGPRPGRSPTSSRQGKSRLTADALTLDGGVLLVDMARRGDLAVLHDVRDVVPGVQELVAAHRNGRLTPRQVAGLTFDIHQRGYHLLLGLRRACDWASIQPRAFAAALESLRATYGAVVCDLEADFEGEHDGGSLDVEERNVMSRVGLANADVVLAVGLPGVKGTHSLLRLLRELDAAGAPAERVVPVCNRAPRSQRARAEMSRALAELGGDRGIASPVFLPERAIDEMAGHAALLPPSFVEKLVATLGVVLERVGRRTASLRESQPVPVKPGSLGHFYQDEDPALG